MRRFRRWCISYCLKSVYGDEACRFARVHAYDVFRCRSALGSLIQPDLTVNFPRLGVKGPIGEPALTASEGS